MTQGPPLPEAGEKNWVSVLGRKSWARGFRFENRAPTSRTNTVPPRPSRQLRQLRDQRFGILRPVPKGRCNPVEDPSLLLLDGNRAAAHERLEGQSPNGRSPPKERRGGIDGRMALPLSITFPPRSPD